MKMHDLYLPDLQRIERLCTRLHLLHPDNAVVQKLREMLVKHIRPLIALVKVKTWQRISMLACCCVGFHS